MATTSLCAVPNCGKPIYRREWCGNHYRRWLRHGSPLGGATGMGEASDYYRTVVLHYDGTDCLIWPYSRNSEGYGKLNVDGVLRYVHRMACEAISPPPTREHEAAHSCGNGHRGCCALRHLVWKTRLGNEADKVGHGTSPQGVRNAQAKLTEDDVTQIRALRGSTTQRKIGAMFGVSAAQVNQIFKRKAWDHIA